MYTIETCTDLLCAIDPELTGSQIERNTMNHLDLEKTNAEHEYFLAQIVGDTTLV